jgi:hypothetical protein
VLGNNDISPRFESSYLEEIQRVSNLVLLLLLLTVDEFYNQILGNGSVLNIFTGLVVVEQAWSDTGQRESQ